MTALETAAGDMMSGRPGSSGWVLRSKTLRVFRGPGLRQCGLHPWVPRSRPTRLAGVAEILATFFPSQ